MNTIFPDLKLFQHMKFNTRNGLGQRLYQLWVSDLEWNLIPQSLLNRKLYPRRRRDSTLGLKPTSCMRGFQKTSSESDESMMVYKIWTFGSWSRDVHSAKCARWSSSNWVKIPPSCFKFGANSAVDVLLVELCCNACTNASACVTNVSVTSFPVTSIRVGRRWLIATPRARWDGPNHHCWSKTCQISTANFKLPLWLLHTTTVNQQ